MKRKRKYTGLTKLKYVPNGEIFQPVKKGKISQTVYYKEKGCYSPEYREYNVTKVGGYLGEDHFMKPNQTVYVMDVKLKR